MNIFMAGATGLIGRHFIERFPEYNYTVLVRSRERSARVLPASVRCVESLSELDSLDGFDAVINLAGEPIVGKRWSEKQKTEICNSRWQTTEHLAQLIAASATPPGVFLSGSAIGYYPDHGDVPIDESKLPGEGFPSRICDTWESYARAVESHTRVVLLRTGIVLSPDGGALQKMLLPFRMGLGGPIADGGQYMSWIHMEDMVQAMNFLLRQNDCHGPFNMVAPEPVSNREFSQTLAHTLHRPAWFTVPALALRLSMGEASCLLLESQRVMPEKLSLRGFTFSYPQLPRALSDLLQG